MRVVFVRRVRDGESPFSLQKRDAEMLIAVLSTLEGHMRGGNPAPIATQIRGKLARAGGLTDESSIGEATMVIGDLCQQVRYANGDYGNERPGDAKRLTTHYLSMPTRESAEACQAEIAALGPVKMEITATRQGEQDVLVTFPELAPDAAFNTRKAELSAIAASHGGRWSGFGGGSC